MNENASPLVQYCYGFDQKHLGWGEQEYYVHAMKQNPDAVKTLLLSDFKHRAENRLNIVCQTYGNQGTGKSLGNIRLCQVVGEMYNYPFALDTHVVFSWENTIKMLNKAYPCTTILTDEQQRSNFGIMGNMVQVNIRDYEDQLRAKQINLFYAAPEKRPHSNFFQFKTLDLFPRDKTGFPRYFQFMLYTKRHLDDLFAPRGIVQIKPPNVESLEIYERLKLEHLNSLLRMKRNKSNSVFEDAERIAKKRKKELLKKNGKPISAMRIMTVVWDEIGDGKYTREGYHYLVDRIKLILDKGG